MFSSYFPPSLKIYSLGVSFAAMYWNTESGFSALLSKADTDKAVQSLKDNIPGFIQRKNLLKLISKMIQSDRANRLTDNICFNIQASLQSHKSGREKKLSLLLAFFNKSKQT